MKNVRDSQLKKAIFLEKEQYEEALLEIFGIDVSVHPDLDGIWYEYNEEALEDEIENVLLEKLADYFDVDEVTSVHADDCDTVGIWVVYKD